MDFLFRIAILALGYFYPAYKCFKDLDSGKLKFEQLHVWCQYWIIIAVFTGFERVADIFISWLPFYSGAKLAFVVYLWHPDTKGTEYIYQTFVKPYLSECTGSLDLNLDIVRDESMRVATILWNNLLYYAQSKVTGVLHQDVVPLPNKASQRHFYSKISSSVCGAKIQQQQWPFPGHQQPLVTQSATWPHEQYQRQPNYPLRPLIDQPPGLHVRPSQHSSHPTLPSQPAPKSMTAFSTVVTKSWMLSSPEGPKSLMLSSPEDPKHHEVKEEIDFEMVHSSEIPLPNALDMDKRNTSAQGARSRWWWW